MNRSRTQLAVDNARLSRINALLREDIALLRQELIRAYLQIDSNKKTQKDVDTYVS